MRNQLHTVILLLLGCPWRPPCTSLFVEGGEAEFLQLAADIEADVLEMAREVERLYKERCSDVTLKDCYKSNYEECLSAFPNSVCPAGEQLADTICGNGTKCSRLWDYSTSRISLPGEVADGPDGNPTDPQVIETICFSRKLDAWFVDMNQQVRDYWKNYGLETPPMYFGAQNGAFRIYPGHRGSNCGGYDPRVRPWYIAASSGPKNILMILDVSGSMNNNFKLDRLKLAAKRIVSTLTVADRVAVVPFESQPIDVIADGDEMYMYMYTATNENKAMILNLIDGLHAGGETNFYSAFQQAFDIFDKTLSQEFNVDCNSAILFLTDGKMTPGAFTENQVIEYVKGRIQTIEERLGHSILTFTYSVSEDSHVDRFPRDLACAVDMGVWSKIETEEEIFDSLTSYYHLFAFGLGVDRNEDFTAWVEPYVYTTGGVLGTTVSAPVYDRDKQPHLFLGVVGFDFRLTAVNVALNGDSDDSLARIVRQSTAKCPALELGLCELESFRHRGSAGDDALCSRNCTQADFVEIEPQKCGSEHDYPEDLWANTDEQGLSYEDRACCLVGETSASDECPAAISDSQASTSSIIIGAVAGVCVLALFLLVAWYARKKFKRDNNKDSSQSSPHSPAPSRPASLSSDDKIFAYSDPPSPIACPPSFNPAFRPSAPVEQAPSKDRIYSSRERVGSTLLVNVRT